MLQLRDDWLWVTLTLSWHWSGLGAVQAAVCRNCIILRANL